MFLPSPAGKNFEGTADGLLKREEGETFLDACLSEEGFAENKLSGGEIQRCRIVRALLSAKEIYVFDEPSPQMDARSEARICQLMGGLQSRGCTLMFEFPLVPFCRDTIHTRQWHEKKSWKT